MKITALISCYNEANTIKGVLRSLLNFPLIEKVVVVDAASNDGTRQRIKELQCSKLEPIFLSEKIGKGEALRLGIERVKTDTVLLCDADIKGFNTTHIKNLINTFRARPFQMVVGLRQKPISIVSHWARKNFLPLIAGERILATELLEQALKHPLSLDWGPEIYLNYYCRMKGIKIVKILLEGVNDLPKYRKGHGIKAFIREALVVTQRYIQVYCFCFPRHLIQYRFSFSQNKDAGFVVEKIEVEGKLINFAKAGQGKNALLFIHGWANNWQGWLPVAEILKNKYKVYLVDLPGFGDSEDLEKYSIQIAAEYLARFLEKKDLRVRAVIGISMGSFVAAFLGKIAPKRIHNIILLGAIFKTDKKVLTSKIFKKALETINGKKSAEILIKKFIETRIAAYLLAKYINMYEFNRFLVDTYGMIGKKKMRKEAFLQMGISASSMSLKEILKDYPLPVLFVYGQKDKIASAKQAKQCLSQYLSKNRFRFVSVPKAGHVVNWEKPRKVAKAIIKFIK